MSGELFRSLRLPVDLDGYVRRQCQKCKRAFRSRPWEEDGSVLQRRLHRCLEHDNPHELLQLLSARSAFCPYCGCSAATEAFLTEAQQRGVKELAVSLHLWIRFKRLKTGLDISNGARPTFVPLAPAPLPQLPDSEDDFQPFFFSCCDEEAKVEREWSGGLHCLRCGRRQGGMTPKATFMLPQALA